MKRLRSLCLSVSVILLSASVASAHRLEPIGTELPASLEKGRLVTEVGFDFLGFNDRATAAVEIPIGIEFSFIKNLQFEMEIPYVDGTGAAGNGMGDMELGLKYQWLQEDDHKINLSTALSGVIPTGSETRGTGEGVGEAEFEVQLGRRLGDRLSVMGNLGYGISTTNDIGEREQEIDLRQALVARLWGETLYATEEFQYRPAFTSAPGAPDVATDHHVFFAPGFIVAVRHGVEFKTSFPFGLTSGDPDFSWRSQLSLSFGEIGL